MVGDVIECDTGMRFVFRDGEDRIDVFVEICECLMGFENDFVPYLACRLSP